MKTTQGRLWLLFIFNFGLIITSKIQKMPIHRECMAFTRKGKKY